MMIQFRLDSLVQKKEPVQLKKRELEQEKKVVVNDKNKNKKR